jgi:hypothetical protein
MRGFSSSDNFPFLDGENEKVSLTHREARGCAAKAVSVHILAGRAGLATQMQLVGRGEDVQSALVNFVGNHACVTSKWGSRTQHKFARILHDL